MPAHRPRTATLRRCRQRVGHRWGTVTRSCNRTPRCGDVRPTSLEVPRSSREDGSRPSETAGGFAASEHVASSSSSALFLDIAARRGDALQPHRVHGRRAAGRDVRYGGETSCRHRLARDQLTADVGEPLLHRLGDRFRVEDVVHYRGSVGGGWVGSGGGRARDGAGRRRRANVGGKSAGRCGTRIEMAYEVPGAAVGRVPQLAGLSNQAFHVYRHCAPVVQAAGRALAVGIACHNDRWTVALFPVGRSAPAHADAAMDA